MSPFRKVAKSGRALLSWWRDKTDRSIIRFKCVFGGYYVSSPAVLTKKMLPEWFKEQVRSGTAKFVRCPGMYDYMQEGYLICAHTDIHIKANSVDVMALTPLNSIQELNPQKMDYEVVAGLAPIRDGVKKVVIKVPCPYGIYMEPGHSAHLMPALMHSPFLDKLFVYPGTVDYEEFHVANFIFSPLVACDFIIPQGTPILHVLPFKRVAYHGISGAATRLESDQHRFGFMSRVKAFYRKKFHHKKHYTIEVENEH